MGKRPALSGHFFDKPLGGAYHARTTSGAMTKQIGSPSHVWSITATVLAGLMSLSALHAAAPHQLGQGPCVACQTLTAPALVPLADAPGRPPEPQSFIAVVRGEAPLEACALRLRPLRAPPLKTLV